MALNLVADPEWQATYHFIRAVRNLKPEVLSDLRDSVQPPRQRPGHVTIRTKPSQAAIDWADRWGINSTPILRRAETMVLRWSQSPTLRASLMLDPLETKRYPMRWDHYPEDFDHPENPYATIGAQPDYETKPHFRRRAMRHFDARNEIDRPKRTKGLKSRPEHFEWLAHRLLMKKKDKEIKATVHSACHVNSADSVRKGIDRARRLLELPKRRRGRPRP